jgi:hypothetical protein
LIKKFKLEFGELFPLFLLLKILIYYLTCIKLLGVSFLEKPNLSNPGALTQNIVSLGLGFKVNPLFSMIKWSYSISKWDVDAISSTIPEFLCFNKPFFMFTFTFFLLLYK